MQVNLKNYEKSVLDLDLVEYLVLNALFEDIDLHKKIRHDIFPALESKGYIRMIDEIPVLEDKAIKLFEVKIGPQVKEVLDHMNKLKKDLGISNRPFKYQTHGRELGTRISEGVDVELIKNMLTYKYNTWVNTQWQMYLRPSTLFNKTKFYNYIEEYEQSNSNKSTYEMV